MRLLWAKFISSERKEDFEVLAEKNSYLDSAYQQLQIISQDTEKRLEYEARQKAILDYNQGMLETEQRGRKEGMEAEKKATAKRLIALGLSTDIIAKGSGLSFEEVQFLENKKRIGIILMISLDKQKRLEYEAREKTVRDYNQGYIENGTVRKKKGVQEGCE